MANPTARRKTTAQFHRERVNRATRFVREHLDEQLTLERVARAACFSPWHFHRVFRACVGETLADHIRRVRLRRAAARLVDTGDSITRIAIESGFETHAAFSRAFRGMAGCSPTEWRRRGSHDAFPDPKPLPHTPKEIPMEITVEEVPALRAFAVERFGSNGQDYNETAGKAFAALCEWLARHDLIDRMELCFSISDDPQSKPPGECRFAACACIAEGGDLEASGEVTCIDLPGGRCAIFRHAGPYDSLWQTWNAIYAEWIPASGLELRDAPPYEVYLNDPAETPPGDLLTEIRVPVT